jgi:hypothetical protein
MCQTDLLRFHATEAFIAFWVPSFAASVLLGRSKRIAVPELGEGFREKPHSRLWCVQVSDFGMHLAARINLKLELLSYAGTSNAEVGTFASLRNRTTLVFRSSEKLDHKGEILRAISASFVIDLRGIQKDRAEWIVEFGRPQITNVLKKI